MRVYSPNVMRAVILSCLCISLTACVTQAVTVPAKVATQTTQTTAKAAGQAAQVAIPDSDDKEAQIAILPAQSKASSNESSDANFLSVTVETSPSYNFKTDQTELGDIKKTGRSDRQ